MEVTYMKKFILLIILCGVVLAFSPAIKNGINDYIDRTDIDNKPIAFLKGDIFFDSVKLKKNTPYEIEITLDPHFQKENGTFECWKDLENNNECPPKPYAELDWRIFDNKNLIRRGGMVSHKLSYEEPPSVPYDGASGSFGDWNDHYIGAIVGKFSVPENKSYNILISNAGMLNIPVEMNPRISIRRERANSADNDYLTMFFGQILVITGLVFGLVYGFFYVLIRVIKSRATKQQANLS